LVLLYPDETKSLSLLERADQPPRQGKGVSETRTTTGLDKERRGEEEEAGRIE